MFLSLANLSSTSRSIFFPLRHAQAPQKGLAVGCNDLIYFGSSPFYKGGAWGVDRHLYFECLRDLPGLSPKCLFEPGLFYLSFSLLLITCCSPWGSSGLSCYKFDLEVEIGNRNRWFCDYNTEGMCPKG